MDVCCVEEVELAEGEVTEGSWDGRWGCWLNSRGGEGVEKGQGSG